MIYVSDLLYPMFQKQNLFDLNDSIGIEFFYEFGLEEYWNIIFENELQKKRHFSIHAPCTIINLADSKDINYYKILDNTFKYGQKIKASHITLHTNEKWHGNKKEVQKLVYLRLGEISELARQYNMRIAIENVGLHEYMLFSEDEYIDLIENFSNMYSLIDIGHAQVNNWDIIKVMKKLSTRIIAFHIHDNDGKSDQHLSLFKGVMDWNSWVKTYKEYNSSSDIVLEFAPLQDNQTCLLDNLKWIIANTV